MFWLPKNEELVKQYVAGIGEKVKEQIVCERNCKHGKTCRDILKEMLDKTSDFFYEKILSMKPDYMMEFYRTWSRKFPITQNGVSIYEIDGKPGLRSNTELSCMLKRIFDYDNFSDKSCTWEWNAYKFAKELGVEVCPYCGRQFISTVIAEEDGSAKADKDLKIIRSELDHYVPKAKFPMFALSFYNLIPSCHFCNASIKHVKELSVDKHIHPYIESDADFSFVYKMSEGKIDLSYQNDADKKVENTCEFFRLKEIYQSHVDIAERYYKEAGEFSKSLLNEYQSFLEVNLGRSVTKKEIFLRKFRISEETENEMIGKFRHNIVDGIVEKYK